jgi:polyisoprenoid-binding protein YceI
MRSFVMRTWPALFVALTAWPAAQGTEQFQVDPAATSILVQVGRSGIFGFAGHDHEVVMAAGTGRIAVDRLAIGRSSVFLEFDAASLKVTGRGEPAEDVPEVQRVMLSERVLDVARYPAIAFQSRSISLAEPARDSSMMLRIDGDLTLHGITRPLTVPARVQLTADRLAGEGKVSFRQSDFGITPVSAGAGTVRVRDQLDVVFKVSARRVAP